MSTDKEIIEKLLKIAENQQKIISKLAQVPVSTPAPSKNLTGILQSILDKLTANNPLYSVMDSLMAGDGTLQVKMKVPTSDAQKLDMLNKFKSAAAAHVGIDTADVKVSQVA